MTIISKAQAGFSSIMLRGGRITKVKGKAGSYAPQLGVAAIGASSSALAVGLLFAGTMALPDAAQAGTCAEVSPGVFECSGPAVPGVDTPVELGDFTQPITVTTLPGFGLDLNLQITGSGGTSFVDENASSISGPQNAITVGNFGSGDVFFSSDGALGATGPSPSTGNALTVLNSGATAGNVTVISTGSASTTGQTAIGVTNSVGSTGDMAVTVNDVTAGDVVMSHGSTGSLNFNATGTITDGSVIVRMNSSVATGDGVTINTKDVSSSDFIPTIFVDGRFTAAPVVINVDGSLTNNLQAINNLRSKVMEINSSGAVDVTVGDVTGATNLLDPSNPSKRIDGIDIDNNNGGAVSLSAGTISASGAGLVISKREEATGGVTVVTNEVLAGEGGIFIRDQGTGDVNVTAGPVTAGQSGIFIDKNGFPARDPVDGSVTLTSNGVSAGGSFGISVESFVFGGTQISVNDDVSVDFVGAPTAATAIFAENLAEVETSFLNIDVASGVTISSSGRGINATNRGGDLAINANGTTIIADGGPGVSATGLRSGNYDSGVSISVTDVTGTQGISAIGSGSEGISITANGTVTGTVTEGIRARTGQSGNGPGGALTIIANNTSGATVGIFAEGTGVGATNVTTTGTTSGGATTSGASNDGLTVIQQNAVNALAGVGTSTTITTGGTVTGGDDGIDARHNGSGALTINTNADVTGEGFFGIRAANTSTFDTSSTAINQAVGTTTTGGISGIDVSSRRGALTIDALGTTLGGSNTGIRASNQSTGTDLLIAANTTTGGQTGIGASNSGTGMLQITTTGATTGTGRDGINAFNGSNGTSLTIAAGDVVMGGNDGIEARNFGSAGLTITADSDVTGAGGSGIVAFNSANDTTASMLISQAAGTTTTGLMDGISASNAGGSLTINALGDTVGTQGSGITATNNGNATTTTILANNASGGVSGIVTSSLGTPAVLDFFGNPIPGSAVAAASGDTTITLTGIAQGGTGAAIDTYTAAGDPTPQAGSLTTINLQAGAQAVAGASGVAIRNNEGNSVLNVADGASITGEVRMGDGSDIAMLAGANVLNGITLLDGGDDESFTDGMVDELTINGFTGTVNSGVIVNWEVVNFIGGTNEVEVEVPTVNTCGGDFSIGGAGTATQVLGCVSNDAQTVTGNAEIFANIEGAGGSDTISITGGAIVDGIVFGGANGNDDSAAFDGGDMITIDTTGFVGGVDGGLGDDQINLLGGRVVNSVDGGGDNDMVTLAGAVVSADVAGGDGNDQIMLNSGSANSVLGGSGDDSVEWNSADATTQSVRMGSGSDTLNINDAALDLADVALDGDGGAGPDFGDLAFNPSLSSASVGPLSVGSAGVDTLNLNNGFSGDLVGAQTLNWDVININGGSVRFSDAAITTGLINVNGGGALDGSNNLAVAGSVAVSAGSRLFAGNATGSNMLQISGNVSNAGTVALAGPGGGSAAGDRLSIGGNYGGTSGSALLFDTVLGGSNATDLMVVGGDLGGNSTVVVTNVGGTGSLTTGSGIKLVQVDGTSAATALNLQGGTIDVGAFRYALVGADDQDWYLQSRARDVVVSTASVARVAQTMGLTSLGTLHERVGEQEHLGLQTNDSGFLRGMWGRALGKDYSENARSASLGDSRSNGQMGGLQMGVDVYRSVAASGARTHVGIFGGHLWSGTTDFGVNPSVGITGTTRSDGWTLGGYLTHYTSTGLYVDVVAQGDWIDHRANGMDGTNAVTKSKGFLASVEVGKAFGKVWKFEPQAQIIYGNTDIDAFTDSANVANRATVDDSVTGRAGFRVKRTWDYDKSSEGGLFTFYAKANIWARLAGGITTLAVGNSAPGVVQLTESWGDVGVGSTFSLSRNAEIFVDADVEYGINQPATALAGRGGLRLRF